MIATVTTFFTSLFSKVWLYVAGGVAALAVLATVYFNIRNGGRAAQRTDDVLAVEKRTRIATQARIEATRVPTPKEEADDPFNRDPR